MYSIILTGLLLLAAFLLGLGVQGNKSRFVDNLFGIVVLTLVLMIGIHNAGN